LTALTLLAVLANGEVIVAIQPCQSQYPTGG